MFRELQSSGVWSYQTHRDEENKCTTTLLERLAMKMKGRINRFLYHGRWSVQADLFTAVMVGLTWRAKMTSLKGTIKRRIYLEVFISKERLTLGHEHLLHLVVHLNLQKCCPMDIVLSYISFIISIYQSTLYKKGPFINRFHILCDSPWGMYCISKERFTLGHRHLQKFF